ncbi:katanin-interacting protein-like isoform X3 [Oculina patagonica]
MEDHHGKWDKSRGKPGKHKEEVPSAKEEVRPEYEEYLLLLQQRNRLLKKLKKKNEQQIEMEKKEQGFSIYVNGANVELGRAYSRAKSRSSSRHTKTAGDAYHERKKILQHELQTLEREAEAREMRVKTAPDHTPTSRKGWKYDSIQIKTDEGRRVKLRAPGKLTGKYSEDFESFAVDGSDSGSDQDAADNDLSDQEELDIDNEDEDDDEVDELALSFNDVKTLRKSLEADESIRESIEAARKKIEEETREERRTTVNNNIVDDNDDDDEIEEELEGANDSLNLHDAVALERLPQLTSTPDGRRPVPKVESPVTYSQDIVETTDLRTSVSRTNKSQSDLAAGNADQRRVKSDINSGSTVTADVDEKKAHQRSKKNRDVLENPAEDLVVLSFSTSAVNKKERKLSATRRKKNADDYGTADLLSSKHKTIADTRQDERAEKNESHDKEVTLTSAPEKKSRPLSATRRTESIDKVDNNVEEIFKAMAEENQTIEKASGSQTAPERSKHFSSSPPSEVKRPSSLSAGPLKTDETIALVTEKVRKMDARQQHHLIELLAKLECKAPFKVSSPSPSPRLSPMKATVPFTPVMRSTSAEGQSRDYSVTDSLDTADNNKENDEGIDVYFEILTNWGNPKYLGLTEIQFFDLEGSLIPYDEQHVNISGHVGEEGALGNLANGKTKTTKGRYMWSCGFQSRRPVELVFHLPSIEASSCESHGMSRIIVWNYNRGIKELNVGAKDVRIFVGGELVWEGVIDKGCGNQVFDYCKVINLTHTDQQPEDNKEPVQEAEPVIRSQTVVLRRSSDVNKQENREDEGHQQEIQDQPVIRSTTVLLKQSVKEDQQEYKQEIEDCSEPPESNIRAYKDDIYSEEHQRIPKPPGSPRMQPKSPRSQPRVTSAEERKTAEQIPTQDRLKDKALKSLLTTDSSSPNNSGLREQALATRSNSTPNLSSSQTSESSELTNDSVRGNFAAGSALPSKPPWLESNKKKDKSSSSSSRSSSRSKSRPIWLENEEASDQGRSSSLTDVRQSSDELFKNDKPHSRPSSGRRSSTPGANNKANEPACPSEFLSKDESLPTCLDGTASQSEGRGHGGSGRRKEEVKDIKEPATEESKAPHDAKAARANWRGQQNLSLEESWSLLSLFEKSHKGRITKDLDLETHGDALDELLSKKDENLGPIEEQTKEMDESLIDLEIPTLPKGRQLVINIRNTWGDRHYVGLNGIEVFTDCGKPAEIAEITADPPDINILPEYGNDPRIVTNLIDGVYRTRDDMHLWLAPFTPGGKHSITITFVDSLRIAMIRIWNYNKSRIHSFRGVRYVDISLDDNLVFQGEIARASGILGADDSFGDTILFTMDEEILEAMAQYDQTYDGDEEDEDELLRSCYFERPSTADQGEEGGSGERPFTSAKQHVRKSKPAREHIQEAEEITEDIMSRSTNYVEGKVLQLNFVSTWGDPYYMGLTGLELLGPNQEAIPITYSMLKACPRDLNDLPEYEDDDRTLDKVINGTNVTMSDEHMWLIPFTEGQDHLLNIDLGHTTPLVGIRVWNYNKSTDDSFRGAKQVHIKLDERVISPPEGFLLRKGPGTVHFDYGQDVYFIKQTREYPAQGGMPKDAERRSETRVNLKKLMPDYEPTLMPCGFVFQFQLFSTWGDPYYIGLNGLEFYDENGYRIRLTENDITAYPHSVNVLEGVTDDIRTPDKLIDGVNDTNDGRHMWLAPILPGMINLIYVVFDEPVTVSMVKVWNYSKTPIRGVQQFGLLVDDLLVYHGILPQVPAVTRGILPNLEMPTPHHTILFTDHEQIALAERKNVLSNKGDEQDIQLTNDKRVVSHYNDPKSAGKAADPALRPKTSVPAAFQKKR